MCRAAEHAPSTSATSRSTAQRHGRQRLHMRHRTSSTKNRQAVHRCCLRARIDQAGDAHSHRVTCQTCVTRVVRSGGQEWDVVGHDNCAIDYCPIRLDLLTLWISFGINHALGTVGGSGSAWVHGRRSRTSVSTLPVVLLRQSHRFGQRTGRPSPFNAPSLQTRRCRVPTDCTRQVCPFLQTSRVVLSRYVRCCHGTFADSAAASPGETRWYVFLRRVLPLDDDLKGIRTT